MQKILALVIALVCACASVAEAQTTLPQSYPGVQDYSRNSNGAVWTPACDQIGTVNIASATTTQIVAAPTNKTIYVCSFALTSNGTTPTFQFEYGTGGTCGTGTTVLGGAFAPNTGSYTYAGGNLGIMFSVPTTNGLCIVSGGTTPSIQGFITYATF